MWDFRAIVALAGALAATGAARAQSTIPAWASGGYHSAAAAVGSSAGLPNAGANGNRVIINGEIQSADVASARDQFNALAASAGDVSSGAGATGQSASAIANLFSVQVTGSWNTVIVSAQQNNSAPISATAGSAHTSSSPKPGSE